MASTLVYIDGTHRLAEGAWESYARMIADGCPTGHITSAHRTYEEQAELYAAYKAGTGNPANKPGTSVHETGNALDVGEPARSWIRAHGSPYGWDGPYLRREPWHFEYAAANDQKETDMATPDELWSFPVHRDEGDVAAIQELADAKSTAIAINAKADEILAKLTALSAGAGFDVDEVALAAALAPLIKGATKADLAAAVTAIKAVIPTKLVP